MQRLHLKIAAQGSIELPAVPGLVDEYTGRVGRIFAEAGRPFSASELAHLRSVLKENIDAAFERSQRSTITVTYESQSYGPVNYEVHMDTLTIEEMYHKWVATRTPPLFGNDPDARVLALAAGTDPARFRILDIGGGTGRNALPLARRGHPVDMVEPTPEFVETVREEAARESLDVRVIHSDIFEAGDQLRSDYSLIVLAGVVSEFRTTAELRALFELAARGLAPGGKLVFNAFLAQDFYSPDDTARQFAQGAGSTFFTRSELTGLVAGLPLELLSDDSVYDYEKAHLPEAAWPPTGWYAGWATGYDVFSLPPEDSPISLRWLVYNKAS